MVEEERALIMGEFSIDDLIPVYSGAEKKDKKEFQVTFLFPMEHKAKVTKYLKKNNNKKRITEMIVKRVESEGGTFC